MVTTLLPVSSLAAEGGVPLGLSGLCEHHESHTEDCYTDELVCGHVVDSGGETATGSDVAQQHAQDCYKLDCQFQCDLFGQQKGERDSGAGIQIITGFPGFDPDSWEPLCTVTVTEKSTVTAIGMPETLAVTLEGADGVDGETAIPVTWECADDYENTEYEVYDFTPVWDADAYALADNLDTGALPYITVNIAPAVNKSTRASTVGVLKIGGKHMKPLRRTGPEPDGPGRLAR